MRPRDWMALVIRSFGVAAGYNALMTFGSYVSLVIKPSTNEYIKPAEYLVNVVISALVGLIFLWSADGVSYMLYPDKKIEEEPI
ncbi:MAG TPA: hypothetical protein VK171_08325 [Fimbriimonas sp.]|nr:hypothetical protein [Fimbriimonas sp.]